MCEACDGNEYDDSNDDLLAFQDAPEEVRESFYDYITEQMGKVIEHAESTGVLYQLITEWPNERIVQFELATIMQGRSLDEDIWNEE